jgi:hypothetical protein
VLRSVTRKLSVSLCVLPCTGGNLDERRYSKAINFAMTSFLDYWRNSVVQRKLISFNLEVSIWDCLERHLKLQISFDIHPGGIWFVYSIVEFGFWNQTHSWCLRVYHKRRIDWDKFSVQVNKFGKARPILNSWYQNTVSLLFLSIIFIMDSFVPF